MRRAQSLIRTLSALFSRFLGTPEPQVSETRPQLPQISLSPARAAGEAGERDVAHTLSFLDQRTHVVLHNLRVQAPGYLAQEFDHIVVGPRGVVHLETKSYGGSIEIDRDGNWTRTRTFTGEAETLENPVGQVLRHRQVLASLLDPQVPLFDMVVLANVKSLLRNRHLSPVEVVKVDSLLHALGQLETPRRMSRVEVDRIAGHIRAHAVELRSMRSS